MEKHFLWWVEQIILTKNIFWAQFKVTTHSNNRNSKSSREVILGSVRLWQSVILRNYDMFSTDSNARYTARSKSESDWYNIKNANKILSIMNNKSWHSLRILNDGRSALWEEKKSVSVMEHAFYQGNVSRLFAVFWQSTSTIMI